MASVSLHSFANNGGARAVATLINPAIGVAIVIVGTTCTTKVAIAGAADQTEGEDCKI